MSLVATLVLLAALVAADCTAPWPAYPDTDTLNTVYAICVQRNVSARVLLATFETAWVESRVWPLDCGDQDSVGVFQQRPSQGWGTVAECTDTVHATNRYLDDCAWNDSLPANANMTAGELAQSVQRSEFPTRYDENEAMGRQLVAQARANAAALASSSSSSSSTTTASLTTTPTTTSRSTSTSSAAPTTTKASTTSHSTTTTSATASKPTTTTRSTSTTTTPKTTATAVVKVPSPLAAGTIPKGCTTYAKGSTCAALQKTYAATLAQVRFWNPSINSACSNMSKTTYYCAKSRMVAPPSSVASGTLKTGCTLYALVASGGTCNALQAKYKISLAQLRAWNGAVNAKCTNLQAGKSYCVAAV